MPWTQTLRAAALLVAALLLAAAGCGGDDEPEDTGATAPPTATVTETETETVTAPENGEAEPSEPEDAAEPVSCGDVAFEPNTDAGAFGISALGVSCDEAREVAAAAEDASGLSYDERGFTCSGAPRGGQLPTIEWVCGGDAAEITFSTS